MNREEILAKAQKQTDERELVIKNKAYKYASEVMTFIIAILALYFVVDAFILENARVISAGVIGFALTTIATIYYAVYYVYIGVQLKRKNNIVEACTIVLVAVVLFKEFLEFIL